MKYGFIGCGNMGGAVARAVCKGAGSGDVLLANRTPAKAQALADELGCACGTNEEVAGICDFIFLGVKPQMMADMLDELTPTLEARAESRPFVLVTMAAGLSMQQIRQMAGSGYPIIRMMPNTPVALGDGMIQYCSDDVEPEKMAEWLTAMAPAGRLDAVPESLIDAASAVSGCGPAWAYQSSRHWPTAVSPQVCPAPSAGVRRPDAFGQCADGAGNRQAPGRIEGRRLQSRRLDHSGVRLLEERAFRGAVTDAVLAAFEKTKDLGKK